MRAVEFGCFHLTVTFTKRIWPPGVRGCVGEKKRIMTGTESRSPPTPSLCPNCARGPFLWPDSTWLRLTSLFSENQVCLGDWLSFKVVAGWVEKAWKGLWLHESRFESLSPSQIIPRGLAWWRNPFFFSCYPNDSLLPRNPTTCGFSFPNGLTPIIVLSPDKTPRSARLCALCVFTWWKGFMKAD